MVSFHINIVNKKESYVEEESLFCGRPSALGNPFIIGADGDRDTVCDKYEAWFNEQLTDNNKAVTDELDTAISIIKTYGTINLVCFCSPLRCHTETIAKWLEFTMGNSDKHGVDLENLCEWATD